MRFTKKGDYLKIEWGLSLTMYIHKSVVEICTLYGEYTWYSLPDLFRFEDSVFFVVVINFTCICNVQFGRFCPKPQKLLYHNSPSTTLSPFPIPVSLKGGAPNPKKNFSFPIPFQKNSIPVAFVKVVLIWIKVFSCRCHGTSLRRINDFFKKVQISLLAENPRYSETPFFPPLRDVNCLFDMEC